MTASIISCSTNEPEIVPEYISNDETDLTGFEFIMIADNSYIGEEEFLGYPESSLLADTAKQRVADIEEKTNCDITIEYMQDSHIQSALTYSISANGTRYSAVQLSNWVFDQQQMVRSGLFFPLSIVSNKLNYLDEEKWGNKNMLESLCWNGEVYGVFPMKWPEYQLRFCDHMIVINTNMATKAGYSDPRAFVENDEWTRSKFKELVENLAIVENGETKVYGLALHPQHIYDVSFYTSGFEHVRKNGDSWSSDIFTDNFVKEMTWIQQDLLENNKEIIYSGEPLPVIDLFGTENAAMIIMTSQFIFEPGSKVAYSGIPFAIMPFPLSDDLNSKNIPWISTHETVLFGTSIPITCEDPEAAAYILNELYEPLPGFETQKDIEDYYMKNVFHDERDMKLYFELFDNCRYTFRAEGITPILHEMKNQNVTQAIKSKADQYMSAVEEFIIPITESRIAVFGE